MVGRRLGIELFGVGGEVVSKIGDWRDTAGERQAWRMTTEMVGRDVKLEGVSTLVCHGRV